MNRKVKIYKAGIHHGEELIVAGNERSGMINFSGCHLACAFCYTPETSVLHQGQEYRPPEFESLLASLIRCGAKNVNLISPTHVWSQIEVALSAARGKVPIILKTSGYEIDRVVESMASVADVFVPDFKVAGESRARAANLPANYGAVVRDALTKMMATHGSIRWNARGQIERGIVVRHLLMPEHFEDSMRVIDVLGDLKFSGLLNLMTRFIDPHTRGLRLAPADEIRALRQHAKVCGVTPLVDGENCEGLEENRYAYR